MTDKIDKLLAEIDGHFKPKRTTTMTLTQTDWHQLRDHITALEQVRSGVRLKYKMTRAEARAAGYVIDDCCNPPVAYKGERHRPDADLFLVPTEEVEQLQAELLIEAQSRALEAAQKSIAELIGEIVAASHQLFIDGYETKAVSRGKNALAQIEAVKEKDHE